jgi:guanosine-3',5'-bis(diphosphate) 3'-pyrophosphohydrolase
MNSTALIVRAAAFAAQKHRNQRRKDVDASPYINHPLALADVLANEAGITDSIALASALLHDTIEDTDTTIEELTSTFGAVIANTVAEVTDDKELPKAARKRMQIEHAAHISTPAKLVKLADKISNVRDVASNPPANWPIERRREYFDWAKAVVEQMRGTHARLETLFDEAYSARP